VWKPNYSTCWARNKAGYIATLSWTPGFPTCVMAIAFIRTPSIQN